MKPRATPNPDFLLLGFHFDLLSQSALGQHGCQELTIEHTGVRGYVRSLALEGDNLAAMAVHLKVGQRIFGHSSYPARLFAAKRPESARLLPRVPFDTTDRLCITVRLMGVRGGWLHGALCVEPEQNEQPKPSEHAAQPTVVVDERADWCIASRERACRTAIEALGHACKYLHIEPPSLADASGGSTSEALAFLRWAERGIVR